MTLPHWDWPQFLYDIRQLCAWSDILHDGWQLQSSASTDGEGSIFARKRTKLWVRLAPEKYHNQPENLDERFAADDTIDADPFALHADITTDSTDDTNPASLIDYEFHVVFHPAYRVPILCFNGYRSDGTRLTLDHVWQLFRQHNVDSGDATASMAGILTEMDHPVLFVPFHTLHPCRTDELLATRPVSRNRVLTFLSSMGPAVQLEMPLGYAKQCADDEDGDDDDDMK